MRWNNHSRPEIGRTWEFQATSSAAMQQLEQVVSERGEIRRELQSMGDFIRLRDNLKEGEILTISRQKFLDLYNKLPRIYSRMMGTPAELMKLAIASGWNRSAFTAENGGIELYHLNAGNYVLIQVRLDDGFFDALSRWGAPISGGLDNQPDFKGRTFSAEDFINAVTELEEGWNSLPGGLELLDKESPLVKVGISSRWMDKVVEMGFEFADGSAALYPVEDTFALALMAYIQGDLGMFEEDKEP